MHRQRRDPPRQRHVIHPARSTRSDPILFRRVGFVVSWRDWSDRCGDRREQRDRCRHRAPAGGRGVRRHCGGSSRRPARGARRGDRRTRRRARRHRRSLGTSARRPDRGPATSAGQQRRRRVRAGARSPRPTTTTGSGCGTSTSWARCGSLGRCCRSSRRAVTASSSPDLDCGPHRLRERRRLHRRQARPAGGLRDAAARGVRQADPRRRGRAGHGRDRGVLAKPFGR